MADPPVAHALASGEMTSEDPLMTVELLMEDMVESQEQLMDASAHLRRNLESARERLHDADPIEGVLPPMAGMEMDALVEMLCEEDDQPAARWTSGG
jgi:hypothetical protein